MTSRPNEPPAADGLTFGVGNNSAIAVRLDAPPPASFLVLLRWLPRHWELRFFDQYFPQISDPGGYVSVQRNEARFKYMVGNHGWTTEWQLQSPELIAAWLSLNLTPANPYSPKFERIEIVSAHADPWT